MKYLSIFLMAICLCLAACNNNGEPPLETQIPIYKTFIPQTEELSKKDEEKIEKCKQLHQHIFVVNSASEIPNDIFGFSEAYLNIDFTKHTLLIFYIGTKDKIEDYKYSYIRNNQDNSFYWRINLGVWENSEVTSLYFSRFAILVNKIPSTSKVDIFYSYSVSNWDWDS